MVNITSPAQSASCTAFEESPGVELPASLAAEPDPALVPPVGAEAEPQNESAVQATQEEKNGTDPGEEHPALAAVIQLSHLRVNAGHVKVTRIFALSQAVTIPVNGGWRENTKPLA